jgi:hypothetical protein
MAFTEKRLAGPTNLSATTETTLYTVPSSTSAIIKQIVVCNTTVGAVNFSLSLVPYGSSAATPNRLFFNLSIAANETVFLDVSQAMTAGDFISAYSSAANVTVTISGVENAGGMVISGLADNAVTTAKIADGNVTGAKLGPSAVLSNNQAGAIILMEMM